MIKEIDFGDIGIKIGDEITFNKKSDIPFIVGSGNGTPGNGGTLICYKDKRETGLFSLRLMTRRLLGDSFSDDLDIFELWSFRGKTLRAIYSEKSMSF